MITMKYSLLLFLTICSFSAYAQFGDYDIPANKPHAVTDDLRGPVKKVKVTEWKLKVKFGKPEKEIFEIQDVYDYDKNGMRLKQTRENGTRKYLGTSQHTYSYNDAGKLSKIDRAHDGKHASTYKFIYDEKGRLKDKDVIRPGTHSLKFRYRYDHAGNTTSITKYHEDGSYLAKREFTWNGKNQMIERVDFDLKEVPTESYKYDYDAKGNIYDEVNTSGRYYFHRRYVYNGDNQKIKSVLSTDKTGDIKVTANDPTYEYDDKGNLVKEIKYAGKEIITWTYTYDEHNNWITKLLSYPDELRNGEPLYELTEREIKYW